MNLTNPEHPTPPRPGRLERALDAGYEPRADDLAPVPAHLQLAPEDPWMIALAASRAQVLAWGLTSCRHPACHTSLGEWDVTYCPHDKPFCEGCAWEDGCPECDALADGALSDIDDEGVTE